MIKEYALEPTVINNWKDFRYFIDNFAVEKGRVISEYPKHWKKMVYSALSGCKPREKKRISEKLNELKFPVLVKRKHYEWKDPLSWLENAIREHKKRPFHAIIANIEDHENEDVLLSDLCFENDSNPNYISKWKVEKDIQILRNAQTMAETARWLLSNSKHIKFIDRNFKLNSKWLNPLKEFLKIIKKSGNIVLLEYHLSFINEMTEEYFIKTITRQLKNYIPEYCKFEFYRWEKEKLHNRYIITDIGSLQFGVGLDEFQEGDNQPNKDIISLLTESTRKYLWNEYSRQNPVYVLESNNKIN